jgi:hypothetical protein
MRPPELVEKLLHPTTGVARGLLKTDSSDKLIKIRVGELREIDTALRQLNRECERAWRAYQIAHEQAMENGSKLQMLPEPPAEQSSGRDDVMAGRSPVPGSGCQPTASTASADATAFSRSGIPNAAQITHMVERFLSWRLPDNFNPDAGISFKPDFNVGTPYQMKHQPTGTNLFDADQAEAMVRHMVEALPPYHERPFGDAGDAVDFACDHCGPEEALAFLEDWRGDRAGEWPGYMKWLAVQHAGAAQAIEARRAETLQDGSVHESAVGAADAPNPGQSSGMPKGGEL